MLNDEGFVEQLLEAQARTNALGEGKARTGPPISTWDQHVEMLAVLADKLDAVTDAVIAGAGGKPGRRRPYGRPKTAYDEAYTRRRERLHERLVDRLLPNRRRPSE